MQYFQWTIGSTTVRNPDRLRDGLKILKETFEGKDWNLQQQERLFNLLRKNRIYEIEEGKYRQMTSARKQEHARKWISILNQLGFCFAYESSNKPVVITKAGKALLKHPGIEEEIFLRQLLKYQKPSALPKQFGEAFKHISILPFVVSLKITHELKGISKEEISIFLNTTIKMGDISSVISQVKAYRSERAKIEGRVKRKEFYYKTQLARLQKVFSSEIALRNSLIKKLVAEFKKSDKFLASEYGKQLLSEITNY